SLPLPRLLLLRADERERPVAAGSPPRCDRCCSPPGGDLSGAPALPALRGPQSCVACVRRSGDPARLALRDGERDRVRRRAELVGRAARRAASGRRASRTRLSARGAYAPLWLGGSSLASSCCRERQRSAPRRAERRWG